MYASTAAPLLLRPLGQLQPALRFGVDGRRQRREALRGGGQLLKVALCRRRGNLGIQLRPLLAHLADLPLQPLQILQVGGVYTY